MNMKLKHENSNPKLQFLFAISLWSWKPPFPSFKSSFVSGAKSLELNRFIRNCASSNQELVVDGESGNGSMSEQGIELQGDANGSISSVEVEVEEVKKIDDLANQSIWGQMKEIVMFIGPTAGLWLCGPLMSLIDTTVIGQRSSLELAALAFSGLGWLSKTQENNEAYMGAINIRSSLYFIPNSNHFFKQCIACSLGNGDLCASKWTAWSW